MAIPEGRGRGVDARKRHINQPPRGYWGLRESFLFDKNSLNTLTNDTQIYPSVNNFFFFHSFLKRINAGRRITERMIKGERLCDLPEMARGGNMGRGISGGGKGAHLVRNTKGAHRLL